VKVTSSNKARAFGAIQKFFAMRPPLAQDGRRAIVAQEADTGRCYKMWMNFACEACRSAEGYSPTTTHPEALPRGWRMHRVGPRATVLLCDVCGGPGAMEGGLSPRVRGLLKSRGIEV